MVINSIGSSLYSMMSIFSPPNSEITVCTRDPLCPTHAPIGSIFSSVALTAIFDRSPASLATALSSTAPLAISGTSIVKNFRTISGLARESTTSGPLGPMLTELTTALMRCPESYRSCGICSDGGTMAVTLPKLTRTRRPSTLCTVPTMISPSLPLYSLKIISRSASRNL